MLCDGRALDGKQFSQRLLRQPDGLILAEYLDLHRPVWRGVEEELI